jgi:hypothetical protein
MPLVVVEIEGGSGLPARDSSGSSDPYVTVQCKSLQPVGLPRRSLTKLQTLEPVWRFYFDVEVPAELELDEVFPSPCELQQGTDPISKYPEYRRLSRCGST